AERAKAHGRLNRALHHATERNAALQLLRDVFGDELRIDFRLADFDDVQMDFIRSHLLNVALQLLNVRALLADDDTRTRRMDRDAALLVRTLDDHAGNARGLQLVREVLADLDVFLQKLAVILLAGIPAGIPRAVDAEAQARRVNLLTH